MQILKKVCVKLSVVRCQRYVCSIVLSTMLHTYQEEQSVTFSVPLIENKTTLENAYCNGHISWTYIYACMHCTVILAQEIIQALREDNKQYNYNHHRP